MISLHNFVFTFDSIPNRYRTYRKNQARKYFHFIFFSHDKKILVWCNVRTVYVCKYQYRNIGNTTGSNLKKIIIPVGFTSTVITLALKTYLRAKVSTYVSTGNYSLPRDIISPSTVRFTTNFQMNLQKLYVDLRHCTVLIPFGEIKQ